MKFAAKAAVMAIAAGLFIGTNSGAANAYTQGLCAISTQQLGFLSCHSGDPASKTSVALIGDSHTRSWFGPVSELAKKYDWKLTVVSKSACPPLDPAMIPGHIPSSTCKPWNQSLVKLLSSAPGFDLVINSSSSLVSQGQSGFAKAFKSMASKITATGAQLLVIRDNPKPSSDFLNCIKANPKSAATTCARDRASALTPNDPMPAAVQGMAGVKTANFTDAYCGAKTCSPVIDGITVYRDHSHISADWAMHLLPVLDAAIPVGFKH